MKRRDTGHEPRHRMPAPPPLQVVLVNPEIPQNTGNIARLCVATGATLHIVGKPAFSLDEKAVRRAGLDYWPLLRLQQHEDFRAFLAGPYPPPLLLTSRGEGSYLDAPYEPGVPLVFGAENAGLPQDVLDAFPLRRFAIPTCSASVRSLNLANAAAIVVYKALEVTGALGRTAVEAP